jgi:hypothetical protein
MFTLKQCLLSKWIPFSVRDLYHFLCIGSMHYNHSDNNLPQERGFKNYFYWLAAVISVYNIHTYIHTYIFTFHRSMSSLHGAFGYETLSVILWLQKTVVIIHSTISKQDNRQQKGKLPTMNTDISHHYAHYNKMAKLQTTNYKQQNNKTTGRQIAFSGQIQYKIYKKLQVVGSYY